MKINITDEDQVRVVIKSLKWDANYLIDPTNDPHETFENKTLHLGCILRVLKHYMAPSEYKAYVKKLREKTKDGI